MAIRVGDFGNKVYWDDRYKEDGETNFDWFAIKYETIENSLRSCIATRLAKDHRPRQKLRCPLCVCSDSTYDGLDLVVVDSGCGNSLLPELLCSRLGLKVVVGVDYCEDLISSREEAMIKSLESKGHTRFHDTEANEGRSFDGRCAPYFRCSDLRDMSGIFSTGSVDLLIDKSTSDAIACGGEDDLGEYFCEIARVLTPGGICLLVTCNETHRLAQIMAAMPKGRLALNGDSGLFILHETTTVSQDGPMSYLGHVLVRTNVPWPA